MLSLRGLVCLRLRLSVSLLLLLPVRRPLARSDSLELLESPGSPGFPRWTCRFLSPSCMSSSGGTGPSPFLHLFLLLASLGVGLESRSAYSCVIWLRMNLLAVSPSSLSGSNADFSLVVVSGPLLARSPIASVRGASRCSRRAVTLSVSRALL